MYCCKGEIEVGGERAQICEDTCCESFYDREGGSMRDSCDCGHPECSIGIRCAAVNCEYNQECICRAEHVDISGAGACCSEETECVTFCGR